jgi:hypothetical protein
VRWAKSYGASSKKWKRQKFELLKFHSPFDLALNSIYKMADSNFAAHKIQGKSSATKTRRHRKRNMKFRNRSQVQGSTFRVKDKQGINDPKPSLKMLIFPNCQFGSKFWMRSDEVDACLVNTHPKFSPETRMEPLAQTWHAKMWWRKPNHIEYESNFRDTSRRTRAGLNP